jgi:hypothetical protein
LYQRAVASFHAEPQRGVPGGSAHLDRAPAAHRWCDEAAAEKAKAGMIEIIALEIIDVPVPIHGLISSSTNIITFDVVWWQ